MEPLIVPFAQALADTPVPLLDRLRVEGAQMLAAHVTLHAGCEVAVHQHVSEQIAVVLSGRVKWILGEERREVVVEGGTFLVLPSNYPHGVVALEDTTIVDILSPEGPMGVDAQKS